MAETGPAPAPAGPIREGNGDRGGNAGPEGSRSAPRTPPRPQEARPAYRGEGGFLLLDKPAGISSFQALRPVKRAFPKAKVGHAGTLDPAASGLLIAGVASGTRLLEYLEGLPKTYAFTAHFGFVSDTYDCEGEVSPHPGGSAAAALTAERVAAALAPFRGRIRQAPPAYSAIKVGGERAYALARAGETVILEAREVEVADLELVGFRPAGPAPTIAADAAAISAGDRDLAGAPRADFVMTCSKGTYVRSLVHDLGLALGCGAVTGALRRLAIGPFRVERALNPEALGDSPALLPLESAVQALPAVIVPPAEEARFLNGQTVTVSLPQLGSAAPREGAEVRAHAAGGRLLAIGTLAPGGRCGPRKVLARHAPGSGEGA